MDDTEELYGSLERFLDEMAGRQLGIEAWLSALGLHEYMGIFSKYSRVEELLSLSEAEVRDLGVKNSAHRARIVSSLVMLREKVQQRKTSGGYRTTKTPPGVSPIHSNSASPPSVVNHPDYAALTVPPYQPLHGATTGSPLSPAAAAQHQALASDNAHDLKNYLWYHGGIPRQKAEVLVCKDGDFLVRDSISQPGDYVLTVRWGQSPLHFVINRQVAGEDSGGHAKVSYQFEEHMFDRVAELVQFYIANKKQVSEMSGALMLYPINRTQAVDPKLSYGAAPAVGLRVCTVGSKSGGASPAISPRRSPFTTPTHSPPTIRRQRRSGSQPLIAQCELGGDSPERRGSLPHMTIVDIVTDGGGGGGPDDELTTPHVVQQQQQKQAVQQAPPPKPTRPVIHIRNRALWEDDGKDYSDYAQVKSWASAQRRRSEHHSGNESEPEYDNNFGGGAATDPECDYDVPRSNAPYVPPPHGTQHRNGGDGGDTSGAHVHNAQALYDVPKNFNKPHQQHQNQRGLLSLDIEEDGDISPTTLPIRAITSPNLDAESCFDYDVFSSGLIPKDNKPLDSGSIATIKNLVLRSEARPLAMHLTYVDLEILKVMGQHDLGMGVFSGLELLTLPQGHRLRQDLIERHHSLRLFVTLTIVTCIKYPERARMLHQWIQVAHELKTQLGNLYGFSAVMAGLQSPQVQRLKNSWQLLRQNNSNSAFIFEAKLLPAMRALDCGHAQISMQHVTIPHVVPLVEMLERELEPPGGGGGGSTPHSPPLEAWEEARADYGLEVLLIHLDAARAMSEQCGMFRGTSENVLREFVPDRSLEDMFRTELHLKVMWGASGVRTVRQQRHSKFAQVLAVLSERVEPVTSANSTTIGGAPDTETSL